MKLTEQCDGHTLTLLEDAEHTQEWNKDNRLTYSFVLPTNPERSIVSTRKGTVTCIRALQGHNHRVTINPNLFSLKKSVEFGRHTYSTRAALPTTNQS